METKTIPCDVKLTEKQKKLIEKAIQSVNSLGLEGKKVNEVFFKKEAIFMVME